MAAPTKSFTVIAAGDYDPDSPVTVTLLTSIVENTENVFSQLVGEPLGSPTYTPAQEHDHDGVNSKIAVRSSLVFDQITGQSAASTGAGVDDIASITVASADLPNNRQAMIVASGGYTNSGGGAYPALGNVRIEAAGVAKQTVPTAVSLAGYRGEFALTEIVELTGGASRVIKVQSVYTSGPNILYSAVNLFAVLIT